MPAKSSSQQGNTQHQWGNVDPWAPAQANLYNILGGVQAQFPKHHLSSDQNNAINTLLSNANSLPNYGKDAQSVAKNLISGGENYQPMVSSAYDQMQGAMSPFLTGNLDPTQTPGISNVLDTIRSDVSNSVNSMFAGAGRDLSGLNQQALARGIAQGEAPVLLNQYNQNVANRMNAAQGVLSGAQSTANTNSGLQQTAFGNQMRGLMTGTSLVPQAANSNAMQALQAAGLNFDIPIQNLAKLEALTVPIAGLGRNYASGGESITNSSSSSFNPVGMMSSLFGGGTSSPVAGMAGAGLGLLGMF